MKRMYNIFFPIFFFFLIPVIWLWVLPINFAIDSLVIVLSLYYLKMTEIKVKWFKVIFKVWIIGFLSDLIGCVILLPSLFLADRKDWLGEAAVKLMFHPYSNPLSALITILAVVIAGYMIYLLNCRFSFNNIDIEPQMKKKLSLYLAVFTAPYVLLIPSAWLYGSTMI